ncbi:pirin family protein [Paludibacterium paludis]|uniref:Quercetin 2,3-dioxygenase n=1 Tax=Paludibacterium paludis TaxID=1225769 RepID=A0A918P757_9NEIS|nr:pirin family protein [Paludibacterium paludis]GGY29849.1 putative quercetin 2,3-dioxygenase [Paludibacterium paludis]
MTTRKLDTTITAIPVSDGAGVKLLRSLGQTGQARLDPFLMLDCFYSDNPDDYLAGFPAHPHRGFETVTYMLEGQMLHEDHLGNRGELRSGGAQWMTAGRGIIHSEMPRQESGRMRGFQLWINLPAREKMKPAHYRDLAPESIPELPLPGAGIVRVIAGVYRMEHRSITGPIAGLSRAPLFFDVRLPAGQHFAHPLDAGQQAFVYPYEGSLMVGPENDARPLAAHSAGILGAGGEVRVAAQTDCGFLLLAADPIGEPIVQYGPFVMNTPEEIDEAIRDYRNNTLV